MASRIAFREPGRAKTAVEPMAPAVARDAVVVGVQELVGGHADHDAGAGREHARDLGERAGLVGDVLERVEQAHELEGRIREGQRIAVRDDPEAEAALQKHKGVEFVDLRLDRLGAAIRSFANVVHVRGLPAAQTKRIVPDAVEPGSKRKIAS